MLNYELFPGFRAAFDPSEITWDVDPSTIKERADKISQGARYPTVLITTHDVPLLVRRVYVLDVLFEETYIHAD